MPHPILAITSMPAEPPYRTDGDLIDGIRDGDPVAFDEAVRRYHERLIQFVFRLLGDRDEAADVVQETFIRAHERFHEFRGHSGLFTWLYRIAYNESISVLRRRKVRRFLRLDSDEGVGEGWERSLSVEENPTAAMEAQQAGRAIREAVACLPPRQRAIFTMRHDDGLSHTEIARVIGRSEGAVRANYFHAVRKLRDLLRDSGLLPDGPVEGNAETP